MTKTDSHRDVSIDTGRRAYLAAAGSTLAAVSAGCLSAAEGTDGTAFTVGTFANEESHCMDCISPSPGWAIRDQLAEASDGEISMDLIGENQICNSATCGGKAEEGMIQAGYASIGNGTNFWPENNVWLLPFTFPSRTALAYTFFDERIWADYWVPFAREYGILPFYGWTPALRNLLLSPEATEIIDGRARRPEDIEGVQIRRTASRPPQVALSEWGASPLELSWGDTLQGMDSGVVHGLETWSTVGIAGGMADVMDQVTVIDFMSGQGVMWANVDWLRSLPSDHRDLIADVTREQTEAAINQAEEVVDDRAGHADPPPDGTEYGDRGITVNMIEGDELDRWRDPVDPMRNPGLYDQERERVRELDLPVENMYEYIHDIAREPGVPSSPENVTLDTWWGEYLDEI